MSNIQLLGMWSYGQIMVGSAQCAHRMRNTPTRAQTLYYARFSFVVVSRFLLGTYRNSLKLYSPSRLRNALIDMLSLASCLATLSMLCSLSRR